MSKSLFYCVLTLALVLSIQLTSNAELIAYYEFESDAKDRSRNSVNADGKFIDTAKISTDAVIGNGSLKLGGYTDYVDLGNLPQFNIVDEITVSAWVKVQFYAEYLEAFVTKGDSSWRLQRHGQGPKVEFSCNGLLSEPDDDGLYQLYSKTSIDDGRWHHIVGLYDGKRKCIYIDGKLDAEQPARGKMALNDYPVYIGENAENPGRAFCGWIDSVAIYNHALTPDEIDQLYNKKLSVQTRKFYSIIKQATLLINEDKPAQAKEYLQKQIDSLNDLDKYKTHTHDYSLYSELFFLLAKATENAGADKDQVVQAYLNIFNYDQRLKDMTDSYLWLMKNLSSEEFQAIIQQNDIFKKVNNAQIISIACYFLENKNWEYFELFFKNFFENPYRAPQFGLAVRDAISIDKDWLDNFDKLFKTTPQWLELTRFEKCQENFNAANYEKTVMLLETFLKNHKGTQWQLDKKALLLAGQSYIQLGLTEKAYDAFHQVIFEYPNSTQAHEALLILGYTYMINNNFDLAAEAFNALKSMSINAYYLNRTNQYLKRINLLTQ